MISDKALAPILIDAAEGEMIMAGRLLEGLSGEDIAWVVIESIASPDGLRITMHAYWHDIFIVSKVVTIDNEMNLTWGATKT